MDRSKGGKATTIFSYGLLVMTLTHVLTHVFGGIHTAVFSVLRDEFDSGKRGFAFLYETISKVKHGNTL